MPKVDFTVVGIWNCQWDTGDTYYDNAWVEHVSTNIGADRDAEVTEAIRLAVAIDPDVRDIEGVVDVFYGHLTGLLSKQLIKGV